MYLQYSLETLVPEPAQSRFRPVTVSMQTGQPSRYGRTARYLHWLSAAVIIWAMTSGMTVAFFELNSAMENLIIGLNVSITTCFIPFFIWRVVHRLGKPAPQSIDSNKKSRLGAAISHFSLYAITFTVLSSGVLMLDQEVVIFGLVKFSGIISDPARLEMFAGIHKYACRLLATMVVIHVLAVIWHHLNGRKIMTRMV